MRTLMTMTALFLLAMTPGMVHGRDVGPFTIYNEDRDIVRTGSVVTPGVGLPTTHCAWSTDFVSGGATYHVEAEGELLITPDGR